MPMSSSPQQGNTAPYAESPSKEEGGAANTGKNAQVVNGHDSPPTASTKQRDPEGFRAFEKQVILLSEELRTFPYALRQLQSLSSGRRLLSSIYKLRKRLAHVLFLFHRNAAGVFESILGPKLKTWDPGFHRQRMNAHAIRIEVDQTALTDDCLPDEIDALALDVRTFVEAMISDFPVFKDDAVHLALETFENQLQYWALCVKDLLAGRYDEKMTQIYVHDLSSELEIHMNDITSALKTFVTLSVPFIQARQRNGHSNLLNLSTVATVFSAVSATTLQFSYPLQRKNALSIVVNCFWFASLVFSIAAAVNSLLILTWRKALYRSPKRDVPWLIMIVIKRSPLVFLAMSVICFSIGLCAFTFASSQSIITSLLTIVLTVITNLTILLLSLWLLVERIALRDKLGRLKMVLLTLPTTARQVLPGRVAKGRVADEETAVGVMTDTKVTGEGQLADLTKRVAGHTNPTLLPALSEPKSLRPTITADEHRLKSMREERCIPAQHALVRHLRFSADGTYLATNGFDCKSVIFKLDIKDGLIEPREILHSEYVQNIAWSPKRNVLLTQYRRSLKMWNAETGDCIRKIDRGSGVESIAWFPDGSAFLCIRTSLGDFWAGTSITKLSNSGKFLANYWLDNVRLRNADVTPDGMRIIGIGQRMSSMDDFDESLASPTADASVLFVYNMRAERVESETVCPSHGGRSIAVARHSEHSGLALITFHDKTSPQSWKLEFVGDNPREYGQPVGKMERFQTYSVGQQSTFSAEMCCFGGVKDELVLATGRHGDISIWNTETGQPLHYIEPAKDFEKPHITSFAWNQAVADPLIFALSKHDGVVCVWKSMEDSNVRALDSGKPVSLEPGSSSRVPSVSASRKIASPEEAASAGAEEHHEEGVDETA